MTLFAKVSLYLAACAASLASAQDPAPQPRPRAKPTIEFRWVESQHTAGLTDAKGIRTSCAPALSFMHSKPALTGDDFARAELRELNHGWSEVGFNLTPEAKAKMDAAREHHGKLLAYVIDGHYKGGIVYPSPVRIPNDLRITLQDPAAAKRAMEAGEKP